MRRRFGNVGSAGALDVFLGNHENGGGFGERLFVARNGGDLDVPHFFDIHLREVVGRSLRVSGATRERTRKRRADIRPEGEFQNEKSFASIATPPPGSIGAIGGPRAARGSLNARRVNKLEANAEEEFAASVPSGGSWLETAQRILAVRIGLRGMVEWAV
jgi:hypothetical protein